MTGASKPSWCFTACKTTALLGLCLTCIGYIYTIVYLISLPQIKIPNPIDKTHSFRSDVGVPVDNTRSKVITVALLIPVRSRHGTNDVSQLSLFQELLPSLLNSILCDIQSNIQFSFYIGYDAGDPFYDDKNHIDAIISAYENMWHRTTKYFQLILPPQFHVQRFVGFLSSPCWVWNGLATHAYNDGIQYFMQINDDTRILTRCWARTLVSVLERNPYNMGVVGPLELNNPKLLTQAMVSRTHYTIFNTLYPHSFRNWYSDDWLSLVYGQSSTFMVDNVQMRNSNTQGTRYKKATEVASTLEVEVDKGKRRIQSWLKKKKNNELNAP